MRHFALFVCLSHSFCSLNMLVNGGVILRSKYQRSRSLGTKIKCIVKTGSIYIKSTLKMITAIFYIIIKFNLPAEMNNFPVLVAWLPKIGGEVVAEIFPLEGAEFLIGVFLKVHSTLIGCKSHVTASAPLCRRRFYSEFCHSHWIVSLMCFHICTKAFKYRHSIRITRSTISEPPKHTYIRHAKCCTPSVCLSVCLSVCPMSTSTLTQNRNAVET